MPGDSSTSSQSSATIGGQMEPFVIGDDFELYSERLEHVLNYNRVATDKEKTSFLIGVGGLDLLKVLKSLVAPKKTSEISFREAIDSLSAHFKPKKNVRAERHKFLSRQMKPDEELSDFIIELKMLADTCDYGTTLDMVISDKFILSMRDERIQRKLIELPLSTKFDKICETALVMELTQKECKKISEENGALADAQINTNWLKTQYKKYNQRNYNNKNKEEVTCYKCQGKAHYANECPAARNKKDQKTNTFKNIPHKSYQKPKVNALPSDSESEQEDNDLDEEIYKQLFLGNVALKSSSAVNATLFINDKPVSFEVDSGAAVTCCSELFFNETFPNLKCTKFEKELSVITGDKVIIVGNLSVRVKKTIHSEQQNLQLVIVKTKKDFTPLLGRNWLKIFFPNWEQAFEINSVITDDTINKLKNKYKNVFDGKYNETISDHSVDIIMKPNTVPIFHKPYTVAYGQREKIDSELDRLVKVGILQPCNNSDWASPVVPVTKPDGSVRICIDCKVTINRFVETEHYPLPRLDDTLVGLNDCRVFCIIDLAGAFSQLKISDKSKEYLTINTQKGLFQYTRLPYGVKSAPAIFQEKIDKILGKIDKTKCYFDDILVGGETFEECKKNLEIVFERLSKFNVKIRTEKCKFFQNKVEYLGHVITEHGIAPKKNKMQAIFDAPSPKDVTSLKAYLGLLNFYAKFVPNLSSRLSPLYGLLAKDVKFIWSKQCEEIFQNSKNWLYESNVLTHYDPNKQIGMVCDSSSYGVGAVLFHKIDGKELPIMFCSSTLSKAEKNYAQLHREALAIMFGVKKFHKFIYGRHVDIYTDHQPLEQIFGEKNRIIITNQRLQRWVLTLSLYDKTVIYRKGTQVANADALSRLPSKCATEIEGDSINYFHITGEFPLDYAKIIKETQSDSTLQTVLQYTQTSWPRKVNSHLQLYFNRKNEITLEDDILLMGSRIIIPSNLRKYVLELLHEGHIGIVRMKTEARSIVWWPQIDSHIEKFSKSCDTCAQVNPPKPNIENNTHWPKSNYPFQRVHMDFFYFNSETYFIVIDSFSKWIDVSLMKQTRATDIITILRKQFSIFGLPHTLISDNGPPYNSSLLENFCKQNNIFLMHSPPYNPTSNGMAERAVQTVKYCLKKFMIDPRFKKFSTQEKLDSFLFRYRNAPTSTTGVSPASKIFNYVPRTKIQVLKPQKRSNSSEENINPQTQTSKSMRTENNSDKKIPFFETNENVWYIVNNNSIVNKVPAVIHKKLSDLVYEIKVNGNRRTAHVKQIRKRIENKQTFADINMEQTTNNEVYDQCTEINSSTGSEFVDCETNSNDSEEIIEISDDSSEYENINPQNSRPKRRRKQTSFYKAKF